MNDFFHRDSICLGILLTLGSEVLAALLLYVGLLIAGQSPADHLRWFGIAFVPPVLILRHYAKRRKQSTTLKAIIVTLFVTFIAFIFCILRTNAITL